MAGRCSLPRQQGSSTRSFSLLRCLSHRELDHGQQGHLQGVLGGVVAGIRRQDDGLEGRNELVVDLEPRDGCPEVRLGVAHLHVELQSTEGKGEGGGGGVNR